MTFTQLYTKTQRLSKDNNADTLTQLKEDINTGYHMFNQKLSRYYARKQQFASIVASQDIYQMPIDSIRVMGVSVQVNSSYEIPLKEVRSEFTWREMKSYKSFKTNWPSHYYILGNDEVQLYPTPSQALTNGLRFYYQLQDHDLSIDDTTSTSSTLATVTNGSTAVTAAGSAFTSAMVGQQFQLTGVPDLTFYSIVAVPNATTLTLKSAFVGLSASGQAWRIGQVSIIPQEYQEAPMHFALGNYWAAQGNETRAQFHINIFDKMVTQAQEDYSSSNISSVIDESDVSINSWLVQPPSA